jgi:hypothetical protein
MSKGKQPVKRLRNDNRPNGKAFKQRPVNLSKRFTGRTVNGYSPAKLRLREIKRQNPVVSDSDVS